MAGRNGAADPAAAARAAYADQLHVVAVGVRLLSDELTELQEAGRDLTRAGVLLTGYPAQLEAAVRGALAQWQRSDIGRAALGLDPLPTEHERAVAMARVNLAAAERRLADARAIEVTALGMAGERRKRIQDCAEDVIRHRKGLAEIEGGPVDAFKSWLRGFAAEIRRVVQESPAVPRPDLGALRDRENALAAREAEADDPLGALIARELDG